MSERVDLLRWTQSCPRTGAPCNAAPEGTTERGPTQAQFPEQCEEDCRRQGYDTTSGFQERG